MKQAQRIVQAHGSIYFGYRTYRCEELRPLQGQYVTLFYSPDHHLKLDIYTQDTGSDADRFVGCAHAIDIDT